MATAALETQVFLNKRRASCGSIKCPIRCLQPESLEVNPRQLDPNNVSRLVEIFKLDACRRLEPQNHVPAKISRDALRRLLERVPGGGASLAQAAEPPMLDPKHTLVYFCGRHRLEAAKNYLHPDDKWWVVDLYFDDLGRVEADDLREEYSNSKNFYDGDIYRHLRRAHLAGDLLAKQRWLAKLSKTKMRDVRLLEKRAEKEPQTRHFQASLDELLPFTGQWPALELGTFHRLLSVRCPEEMTRYLKRVKSTWDFIIGEDESLRGWVDIGTVTTLEGRCPKHSMEDEQAIQKQKHQILPTAPATHAQDILARVYRVEHTIPSIHTFLEDTKLLEPCAKILKRLLPTACKTTILNEFNRIHNGDPSWLLQTSEATYSRRNDGSGDIAHKNAYRQLWLYAMRHFPEMLGQPLRKDPGRPKPKVPGIELIWWYRFTELAENCGYTEIDRTYYRSSDADFEMAQTFIQQMRPSQLYSAGDRRSCAQQMIDLLDQGCSSISQQGNGTIGQGADVYGIPCGPDTASRCGVPLDRAFWNDQRALFLPYIDRVSQAGGHDSMGSFFVKRDVFHSFLGHPEEPTDSETRDMHDEAPPDDAPSHDDFSSTMPPEVSSEERARVPPEEETDTGPCHPSNPIPAPQADPTISLSRQRNTILEEMRGDTSNASVQATTASQPISRQPVKIVDLREAVRMVLESKSHPDRDKILVLRERSSEVFEVLQIARLDKRTLASVMPPDQGILVPEWNRQKRLRTISPAVLADQDTVIIADGATIFKLKQAFEDPDLAEDIDDIY